MIDIIIMIIILVIVFIIISIIIKNWFAEKFEYFFFPLHLDLHIRYQRHLISHFSFTS